MPTVTVVIPSYNQANFLEVALQSVVDQPVDTELVVVDGGSTDCSVDVIRKFESRLFSWRSFKDKGQAAAINEGIMESQAPYVCWLNSDDFFLPGGLLKLLDSLETSPSAPAVYGKCLVVDKKGKKKKNYWTAEFSEFHLSNRCFIAQPATLIRRCAWEQVGGLNERLHMSMDYDLWWRLFKRFGPLRYTRNIVAASRWHQDAKTSVFRHAHYRESMSVVRKHFGSVPLKWYLAWPFRVVLWDCVNRFAYRTGTS